MQAFPIGSTSIRGLGTAFSGWQANLRRRRRPSMPQPSFLGLKWHEGGSQKYRIRSDSHHHAKPSDVPQPPIGCGISGTEGGTKKPATGPPRSLPFSATERWCFWSQRNKRSPGIHAFCLGLLRVVQRARTRTMGFIKLIVACVRVVRDFFAPRYHPERHYMRGPGPACAQRESRRGSAHA